MAQMAGGQGAEEAQGMGSLARRRCFGNRARR
jgi:hypothetical protein